MPDLVISMHRECWETFRGALGGDLSGHVSQEAGRHGFPPTLEKLRRELLAYEGAPGVIRWGGLRGSYIKSRRKV